MSRNIYINVRVQVGNMHYFIFAPPQILDFPRSTFSCDLKTPAPYLQLFDHLRAAFNLKKIKAISFVVCLSSFQTYAEFYQFRQKCYDFCQANGIFYYSPRQSFIDGFTVLSQTNTMVKEGEKVTIIKATSDDIVAGTYIREKSCYRCFEAHHSDKFKPTTQWKKEFMNGIQSKKIIFLTSIMYSPSEKVKKMFKRHEKFFITPFHCQKAMIDMVQHVMGEKASQYYIPEIFVAKGMVSDLDNIYIRVMDNEILPLEKSVIVDVDPGKSLMYSVYYNPNKPVDIFEQVSLSSFKCKKVKATIKIDINGFYDFKVEPYEENLSESFSKITLDSASSFDKVRMVFDKQTFTVLVGDEKNMEVLKDVDGLQKIPIYIAFIDDKKPSVGNIAKKIYSTNSKAVVFDLIKLCSIDNADVMSPKWCFKLEKEDDESLMVTMDTVDGERRSSVDFLLALILKHGLRVIKNENGKKMEELEIGFDGFAPNEILKKNFEKAAALINLKIVFV